MKENTRHIHFIAIGGSIMHNLAIALHRKGFTVTGSDDAIFGVSNTRLTKEGLLPDQFGWFPEKITSETEIILGMHAKADNPELAKAKELNCEIYSFPEYIYKQSIDKQRIVIAGSHGKTSITSIILHILKEIGKNIDYAVGATIEGFDNMVKLSDDAPVIIIEGDEYLNSTLDRVPKFLKYQHHIALISGIAWDHINAFPTEEEYTQQFRLLSEQTPKAGSLLYNKEDNVVAKIVEENSSDILKFDYSTHPHKIIDHQTYLITPSKEEVPIKIFGKHNLSNISAAKSICDRLCVTDDQFYTALKTFTGAGKRLELVAENDTTKVFKDFAHSPSKLAATCKAVKEQFGKKKLIACFEAHTFSSLNSTFLANYKGTLGHADEAYVFIDPEILSKKGNTSVDAASIKENFGPHVHFIQEIADFTDYCQTQTDAVFLLMSSGNLGGLDIDGFAKQLVAQ